ncbi:L-ribulose-5-phosphate 3-epimerase [Streptacidiphilus sp. MAP12-16]|uniref:EboA domain-containing protein n=1 Tax=Streptacidiphilus sp. MAP12-16 TaxID=3156300 RepID=UPI0035187C1F
MRPLRFAYGTNGFADHRLSDALGVLADLGYQGVSLTLDHHHLDPYARDLPERLRAVRRRLEQLGLAVVVETGARYLLDPVAKHQPTLLSPDPGPRLDLLLRAIRMAPELGSEVVSLWSGTALPEPGAAAEAAFERLRAGCAQLLDAARAAGVRLGFEPEPGMFVADLAGYERLAASLGDPDGFGLTLDLGHCLCVEDESVADCVRRAGHRLVHVQIEDMRRGVHEHLEFGTGEVEFPPALAALAEVGYAGLVSVELPRHSHAAPTVARRSLRFLEAAWSSVAGAAPSPHTAETDPAADPTAVSEQQAAELDAAEQQAAVLEAAVLEALDSRGTAWLRRARTTLADDPSAILDLFPAAARETGRGPLRPSDDADGRLIQDAVRALLLRSLTTGRARTATWLYQHGDAAERRAVLLALPLLDAGGTLLPLVHDALRTNDRRLVAAALGRYGAHWLDQDSYRHAVLKCLFLDIPLSSVHGLSQRQDAELGRMVASYAEERTAASRPVPVDAQRLLDSLGTHPLDILEV